MLIVLILDYLIERRNWFGSGDDGFIIVSFGYILKNADVPHGIRRLFLSTFAREKFKRPADEAALTCGGDEHHLHYDFTLSNFVLGLLESWLLVCDFSFSSGFSVGCILLYCVTCKKMSGVGWASRLISRHLEIDLHFRTRDRLASVVAPAVPHPGTQT